MSSRDDDGVVRPYCEHCDDTGFMTCAMCDGDGMVMVCPDDLCLYAGECMHNYGMRVCGACKGSGKIECRCEPGTR